MPSPLLCLRSAPGPALHFGPFPSLRIASRLTLFYFLPFYGIIVVAVSFGVPF